MEVTFSPDLQVQIDEMARDSGRAAAEMVRDAVAGYVEGLRDTRVMLEGRYDEIKGAKAVLIDGETAFAQLHERIEARRKGGL